MHVWRAWTQMDWLERIACMIVTLFLLVMLAVVISELVVPSDTLNLSCHYTADGYECADWPNQPP